MRTNEMVKDYFLRAKWCLKEAEMALSENFFKKSFNRVIKSTRAGFLWI